MNDSLVIQTIMLENDLTQVELANRLGVKKQVISYIVGGKRMLTKQQKEKLLELYPDIEFEAENTESNVWLVNLRKSLGYTQQEFADKLHISQALYGKLETGARKITSKVMQRIRMFENNCDNTAVPVHYCPNACIPSSAIHFPESGTMLFDKRIFVDGEDVYNPSTCYVVRLTTDALFPEFSNGDMVIIDTSQKVFKMDGYYLFKTNNIPYVRKIVLLPDKIKCTSTGNSEDTFYLPDTKGADVIGRILPRVRV